MRTSKAELVEKEIVRKLTAVQEEEAVAAAMAVEESGDGAALPLSPSAQRLRHLSRPGSAYVRVQADPFGNSGPRVMPTVDADPFGDDVEPDKALAKTASLQAF